MKKLSNLKVIRISESKDLYETTLSINNVPYEVVITKHSKGGFIHHVKKIGGKRVSSFNEEINDQLVNYILENIDMESNVTKVPNSIYTFENEEIKNQKSQQLNLFERMKHTSESYNYWYEKFMSNQSDEVERKMLKAFEFYAYDKFNMDSHIINELKERLRVANELLEKNGITLD